MFKINRSHIGIAILAAGSSSLAQADATSGVLQLSGSIPEIFSLQVRGVPGDLDFSPNVVVTDRLLGIFHLKYNIPIATIILSSGAGATGLPTLNGAGATPVPLGTSMTYTITCGSIGASGTGLTAANLGAGATNINVAAASVVTTNGFEHDCPLTASWTGTAGVLPVAGTYSMTITFTMTST